MAPSLVASYNVNSITTGSGDSSTLSTTSFTPGAGEVILVKAQTWDHSVASGTPSGGGLTYAQPVTIAPGVFSTYGTIFTATVGSSPSSMSITLSAPASSSVHSMTVERWSGAQLATTPVTVSTNYSSASAAQASMTTSAPNSVISYLIGDAQSVAPPATYLSNNTQDGLCDGSGGANSVQYYGYMTCTTATSYTFGQSAPTTEKWVIAAIEIEAAAGPTDDAPPWHFYAISPGGVSPGGLWVPAAPGDVDLHDVALDDPGTGADSLAVTAAAPLADTAAAADTLAVSQPVALADTASAVDALVIAAAATLADTASAADVVSVTTTLPLADSAGGADALAATAAVPLADAAVGADALAETATVPLSDSATAADALSVGGSATPSLPDTASAVDTLAVTVLAPLTDTASAADLARPAVALTLPDTAAAGEQLTAGVVLTLTDLASAVDAAVGVLVPDITRGSMAGSVTTRTTTTGSEACTTSMTGGIRPGSSMGGG